jgi:hypothetical protein
MEVVDVNLFSISHLTEDIERTHVVPQERREGGRMKYY